jgi:hypothetical protein
MTLSYTASPTPTANINPQPNGLSSGMGSNPPNQANGASIAGGIVGALIISAAVAAGIIYYKNRHYVKQSRSPVTSSSVIVNNPIQMQGVSESTIYAHHV